MKQYIYMKSNNFNNTDLYLYHYMQGNISKDDLISRYKFEYQNIHMNLGNTLW